MNIPQSADERSPELLVSLIPYESNEKLSLPSELQDC